MRSPSLRDALITPVVLCERSPQRVADAAEAIAGVALREIESSVPDALGGERTQVRAYVNAYRLLESRMLDTIGKARPDLILVDENHNVSFVEAKTYRESSEEPVRWLKAALEQEAMSAPLSEWVGTLGVGRGTAVAFVALLRSMLRDTKPLAAPRERHRPAWALSDKEVARFYRAVADELARVITPLDRVASALDLSRLSLPDSLASAARQSNSGKRAAFLESGRRSLRRSTRSSTCSPRSSSQTVSQVW